ncbi:MAG TPA: phenylacetate--CoA ligase family protein, partial [Candidatus Binatia bacterium]
AAVEGIVRSFSEIEEFRVEVFATDGLSDLKLTLEPAASSNSPEEFKERVRSRVQNALGLRPTVELVGPGALPRFELKARRFFKR